MLRLNPGLDVKSLAATLASEGFISIQDILEPGAEVERATELATIPGDWWTETMNISGAVKYKHNISLDGAIDEGRRSLALTETREALAASKFCYHFKDARVHFSTCGCIICRLKAVISGEEFAQFFRSLTGNAKLKVSEIFASKYERGHFLSIHHDKNKGAYAFVFSFNKDWYPPWGGLLHFVRDGQISRVCIPSFNTLTIFTLPEGKQIDHYVGEVVGPRERFSVTGWLN
jgi:Rps23 Pro-64 3,4-dihydroxylase Tpa1-like proline 4-hydroxylase